MTNYNVQGDKPQHLEILLSRLTESNLKPTFVPLKWGTKIPITKNWTEPTKRLCIDDLDDVDYSQYGLGLVTCDRNRQGRDRLVIVDIDTRDMFNFATEHGLGGDTLAITSGKKINHGELRRHLYYKLTDDQQDKLNQLGFGNRPIKHPEKFDLRRGDTNYTQIPTNSPHPDTKTPYRVLVDKPIQDLPDTFFNAVLEAKTPARGDKTATKSTRGDINLLSWQKEKKKPLYLDSDRNYLNLIVSPNLELFEAFLRDHNFSKVGDEFCGHPLLRESASGKSFSATKKNGGWEWIDRATQGDDDPIGGDLYNYYLFYVKRLTREEKSNLGRREQKKLLKECLKYYCKKKNIIIPHRYERKTIHTPQVLENTVGDDPITTINWGDKLKPIPSGDVKIIYGSPDDLTDILNFLQDLGYKFVLDISPPGAGKSHNAALQDHRDLGLKAYYYISQDYLNRQVETLRNFNEDVARHNGVYSETRPNGDKRRRRVKRDTPHDVTILEDCNCTEVERFNQLRTLGIEVPTAILNNGRETNAICGTCGAYPDCEFIRVKKDVINLSRKIGHPHLYNSNTFNQEIQYKDIFVVCDEISQHPLIVEAVITKEDINNLISKIWDKKISLPQEVEDKLRSLIDVFAVDNGDYGLNTSDIHFNPISTDYDFNVLRDIFTPAPHQIGNPDLVNFHIFTLLEVLCRRYPGAVRTVKNGNNIEIVITFINNNYITMLNLSGLVLALDATMNPDVLKKILGVEKIAIIERKIHIPDNLEIIQIYPDRAVGASRVKGTEKYINTIIEKIRDVEGDNIGILDYGKFKDNYENAGKYFADSRGSNDYLQNKTLVLVGTIRANLNALISKFQTIYNRQPDITRVGEISKFNLNGGDIAKKIQVSRDTEFQKFVDDEIESETIQAVGRLRAHRRPDEKLKVYIISDYPYKFKIDKLIDASEFCPELMSETEKQTLKFINHAIALNDKCTLTRLINSTKIPKPRISEICNSILTHQLPAWLHDKIVNHLPIIENLINKKSLYNFINNKYRSNIVYFTHRIPKKVDIKTELKPTKIPEFVDIKCEVKYEQKLDIFATSNHTLPDISKYIKTVKPYADVMRVILDIETIGLDPTLDESRVIAVGLKLNDGDNICITGITEKELLVKTIETIEKLKPEIIVGHNVFNFDLPFLMKRMEIYGIKSPFKYEIDRNIQAPKIKKINAAKVHGKPLEFKPIRYSGAAIIDTYQQIIIWDGVANKLTSYGLKRIREQIGDKLGIDPTEIRLELTPDEIKTCYETNNMEQLLIYLGQDLDDTYKLSEFLIPSIYYQQEFLDWGLQSIATSGNASKWSAIMAKMYPNLNNQVGEPKRQYEGGLTASRGGVWRNVAKIDITSLYPSVMLNYQIKPKLDIDNKFLGLLQYLLNRRLELKELAKAGDELANQRQGALKVLINSAYGFLGTNGVPFNDFDAAEKVTKYGREILKYMMSLVEKHGGTWIECDTDGIYYTAPDQESLLYVYNELCKEMPVGINVELEVKHARGAIIPKKQDGSGTAKNYIIVFDDPKKDIKKGKFIKRDRTILEKEFYHQYCRLLITSESQAYQYYVETIESILDNNMDVEKLKRREKIRVNAKRLLLVGKPGDVISWYENSRGLPATSGIDYDVDYYIKVINKNYIEIKNTAGLEINLYEKYNGGQLSLF